MKGKRISLEIKNEALEKIRAGRTVKEVAQGYGFDAKNIYNWLSCSALGKDKEALEISHLMRENEALRR